MPYLDKIVEQINNTIISSLNFQIDSKSILTEGKIKSYGIAEQFIDASDSEDQKPNRYPAIINDDGEVDAITPDDIYDIIFYHRLEGIVNANTTLKNTFGRLPDIMETVNMSIVFFAFRNKIRRTGYWLEGIVKDKFPDKIVVKDNDGATLQQSPLKIGNSNFDKLSILQREYSEVQLNYAELIVFEFKYLIQNTFKRGCLDGCNDC